MRLGIIAIMAAPLAACLTLSSARAQPDCANWNSSAFFATAGAADVRACLRAGADPGARDKYGATPFDVIAKELIDTPVYRRLKDAHRI